MINKIIHFLGLASLDFCFIVISVMILPTILSPSAQFVMSLSILFGATYLTILLFDKMGFKILEKESEVK